MSLIDSCQDISAQCMATTTRSVYSPSESVFDSIVDVVSNASEIVNALNIVLPKESGITTVVDPGE